MHPYFLKKNFKLELLKKCFVCGCTDNDCTQCIERTGSPCYWVTEDLCSACANMKFIPLLFSTLMVQALLRKTQTRRTKGLELINKNPDKFIYDGSLEELPGGVIKQFEHHFFEAINENKKPLEKYLRIVCPYGKPGDVLWVRESFLYNDELDTPYSYKAEWNNEYQERMKPFWKPSIHMPKEACRHFLLIKNIRVERLQDIIEYDAKSEGVEFVKNANAYRDYQFDYLNENRMSFYNTAKSSFQSLWSSINGEDSWKQNPWVWVIEFEKIAKPGNFLK